MKLPLRPASSVERQNALQSKDYILNQYPLARNQDKNAPPSSDAIELIARTVRENSGEITLIAIGPLTNIAAALCRYPELTSQIRAIAIMGGELTLNRAEHNVSWDAHAAEIVFACGLPIFVGTWSVTRGFTLSPEECGEIKAHNTELSRFLSEAIELWWPFKAAKPGPVMYDLAPILWTFAPEYFSTEEMPVRVETRGEHTRGFTVRGHGAPNATVTTAMQTEAIRHLYLQTILLNA